MANAAAARPVVEAKAAAAEEKPFTEEELDRTIRSFQNLADLATETVDWAGLRELLSQVAHVSHKDWTRTEASAEGLAAVLPRLSDAAFRGIFERVLEDGGWDGAAATAAERPTDVKPWVVLVTGVNGSRKTTTIYQSWFKDVLYQALLSEHPAGVGKEELPDGNNSFFRQLDYIITTVANEDFSSLFGIKDIETYAAVKDGIYARYRTIAEMVGVLLVKEAQQRRMNVFVETSGRDIAMFHYIDHLFPDSEYRKLVVHFTINDVAFAERSVDTRMLREMQAGTEALAGTGGTRAVIKANAGGPYGSKVLRQVQTDSNKVWEAVRSGEGGVATSWYKASLRVEAKADADWTVVANTGNEDAPHFEFEPRA